MTDRDITVIRELIVGLAESQAMMIKHLIKTGVDTRFAKSIPKVVISSMAFPLISIDERTSILALRCRAGHPLRAGEALSFVRRQQD